MAFEPKNFVVCSKFQLFRAGCNLWLYTTDDSTEDCLAEGYFQPRMNTKNQDSPDVGDIIQCIVGNSTLVYLKITAKTEKPYNITVERTYLENEQDIYEKINLAANSGSQLYTTGVWYAKMYAETVAPSAENGTNYADFSQKDSHNNPIIVIYERQSGSWIEIARITPPADYNGYITVTSKIWDIAEQSGQQGGEVLWSHNQKTFTPYPRIVSFESIHVTGDSTVVMPNNPSGTQIVNKDYVDGVTTGMVVNNIATNCITQIPGDIKLELSSGTLTLKAGSKVYVPNGTGVFDTITTSSDVSIFDSTILYDDKVLVAYNSNNNNIIIARMSGVNTIGSGPVADRPAASSMSYGAGLYYATDENKLYIGNQSANTWTAGASLPIAIATVASGVGCTSINQTFNGLGYIGSTLFVLPGVKGLIPNGRNANGAIQNTEFTISAVGTVTIASGNTGTLQIRLRGDYFGASTFNYDEETNYNFFGTTQITPDNRRGDANVGEVYVESGVIKSLTPKYAFHAVDYSEFKTADNNNPKLNQTRPFVAIQTMRDTEHASGTYVSDAWHNTFLTFQDANGTRVARVQGKFITGTNIFELGLYAGDECIRIRSNGVAFAPANSDNNTILTTVAKSKNQNGYFKLGNGMIIQWGRIDNVDDYSYSSVVLPTAFTSSNYSVVVASAAGGGGQSGMLHAYDLTTTGFKVDCSNVSYTDAAQWIAIGW